MDISCTCGGGYYLLNNFSSDGDQLAGVDSVKPSTPILTISNKSASCVRCPDGTYSNESTALRCEICPPGMIPASSAHEPTKTLLEKDRCEPCPPGSFSDTRNGSAVPVCRLCPAGSFTSGKGHPSCEPCRPGYFAGQEGSTQCSPCASGSYSMVDGASECWQCPAGTFSRQRSKGIEIGLPECLACPRDSYQDQTGSVECRPCPDGTVARLPGMTRCLPCLAGSFYDSVSRSCLPCPRGSFSEVEGSNHCGKCPNGTSTENWGSSKCLAVASPGRGYHSPAMPTRESLCEPGTFNDGTSLKCRACSYGLFAADRGSTRCLPCPRGSFAPAKGSTSCQPAPIGYFVDSEAARVPTRCDPNTFASTTGSTQCDRCPNGSYSTFGGSECNIPAHGEVLQDIVWRRVMLTTFGTTIDDFSAGLSLHGIAVASAVRDAFVAFTSSIADVHVLRIERGNEYAASAVEFEFAVETSASILSKPSKTSERSWHDFQQQIAEGSDFAMRTQISTTDWTNDSQSSTMIRQAASGTGSIDVGDDSASGVDDLSGDLSKMLASKAFLGSIARNLERTGVLNRSMPLVLFKIEQMKTPWRSTRAVPCPPGSFFDTDGRACRLCAPGSFSANSGADSCFQCPQGTFAGEEGMGGCDACALGSGSALGSTSCVQCTWFSRECSGFSEQVVVTLVLGTAVVLRLVRRVRTICFGDRHALQRSQDAALLAGIRTYGRVVHGRPNYAAMVSWSCVEQLGCIERSCLPVAAAQSEISAPALCGGTATSNRSSRTIVECSHP